MTDQSSNTSSSKKSSTVDTYVVPFGHEDDGQDGADEYHLSQLRNLFVDGMRINNAPEDYIEYSLQSDLNDKDSMRKTYRSGRGSFIMLCEDEEDDDIKEEAAPSNNARKGNNGSQRRRTSVKGMVGLEDISPQTGSGKEGETRNLLELRRMSIHSSCRRSGYGAKLIQECISHAKEKKFDGIKLYTGGWMEAAIQFYKKMGFEDMGRLDYTNTDGSKVTIAHLEMIFDQEATASS